MAPVAMEPLVRLANADKWLTESLESVLTQGGYRVIVTAKRSQVLDVARRQLPDALLLDMALEQRTTDSLALCRALRADPAISRATPIIFTTAGAALGGAGRLHDAPGHAARVRRLPTRRRRAHRRRRGPAGAGVSPRRTHLGCGRPHRPCGVHGLCARDG